MFGGHLPELFIILVLALIVFGPQRLPEIAGAMGKGIRDFKSSMSDVGSGVSSTTAHAPLTSAAADATEFHLSDLSREMTAHVPQAAPAPVDSLIVVGAPEPVVRS